MEEASVAGESPDSSRQRESSEEPTSGSAGPVPGARGESRDPRLAVTREEAEASGRRADTATRVLSAPGGPGGSGPGGPERDERLRAAVAAWVTSPSGGEAEEEASGAPAGGAEGEEASAEDSEAQDASTDGSEAQDASTDSSEGSEAEGARDAEGGGGADAPAEAEEARAEDAGEDRSEDAGDAEGSAVDDAEAAGGRDADAVEDRDAGESDASDEADGPGDDDRPEVDPAPNADTDSDTETNTDPDSDPAPAPDSDPDPDPDPDNDGGDDTDTAPEADGSGAPPVDQPTAVFKAVRLKKPEVDQPTTMLKLGDALKPPTAPTAPTAPAEDPEPPATPKPPAPANAERTSKFVALKPLADEVAGRPVPGDVTSGMPQVGPERTTQQPLPPKPPLDLLAELTNTPPPPATPMRTLARRVKIWTPLVLLLAIVFAIVQAVRPLPTPTLTLTAQESYSFEGDLKGLPWPSEGQGWMDVHGIGTMSDFGEQKPVAIGSVAKAMTAYVVLKDHPLKEGEDGEMIPVDALAEKEGGYNEQGESTLNTVKDGDQISVRDAVSAIMIPSANNIARLMARWDAGSEEAFIEKMNETAKELGMTNTTYTDASGLKETTVSTAEDQVKLGNELVKMDELMKITSMGQWTDPSGQKWYNYNYLVPYDGAIGIKTGTTTAAGGNLLFASRKEVDGETVTLVGAILGQHKAPIIDTVNAVSKTAMLGAQEALTPAKILEKGDVVGYVDDGLGGRTPVVVTEDVTAVGWAGLEVKLSFASDDVPHTAKAGTKVGTLTVGDDSGGAVEVPVALQGDLAEPGFMDKLTRIA
ncbi:serine hydrolase [Streptomyces sp. NPDC057877]|uniref:serine hydrolase n=1 Tax=Streptomyces sp. NPDC057877 TaxID=3346269 RepID=UPI0036AFB18C